MATGWPTSTEVAEAMGLGALSVGDAAWLDRCTAAAVAYADSSSPLAWGLASTDQVGPSLWQGTAQLAALLYQRRSAGIVAPDFGGEVITSTLDQVTARLLRVDRYAPPRAR
jgi:hypothetical protein